jgi:hypothetical protein
VGIGFWAFQLYASVGKESVWRASNVELIVHMIANLFNINAQMHLKAGTSLTLKQIAALHVVALKALRWMTAHLFGYHSV